MTISKTSDRSTDTHIHMALDEVSRTREALLVDLPNSSDDLVIEAQRLGIQCVLDEVQSALTRLEQGRYGTCQGCMTHIPMERLRLRPWAAFCVHCAGR